MVQAIDRYTHLNAWHKFDLIITLGLLLKFVSLIPPSHMTTFLLRLYYAF